MRHEVTEKAIMEIIACVKRQGRALETYLKQMEESKDNAMYSAIYLQKNVDEKLQELVRIANNNYEFFNKHMEEIRVCEGAIEENVDITAPDFQSAVSLISVCGEGTPSVITEDIVKALRGQHRALKNVKELMERKGIIIASGLNKYFSIDGTVEVLAEKLNELSMDPNNSTRYIAVAKAIVETADVCGLNIDAVSEIKSGFDYDYVHTVSLRNAMGL